MIAVEEVPRKNSPEQAAWAKARDRCNNPRNKDYARYGGRGIRVCERWNSLAAFFADMGPRPEGMTLERIDVNGDYCPENCRWATWKDQAANRSNTKRVEYEGEMRSLPQLCNEFGIDNKRCHYRLRRGWTFAEVLAELQQAA